MKRVLRIVGVLIVAFSVGSWLHYIRAPKSRVHAPTTRYHGYMLNWLAINKAKSFTVLISSEGFGGIARGTGVLIDATHVLTCAHMVESPNDDLWIFPYPVAVVAKGKPIVVSRGVDLAILELNRAIVVPHYPIFQEMHYDGEPITIIGNILGAMRWFTTFGIVSGEWDNFLLTDGVLYGGNSGGPWINERGEIVALTDWTLVLSKGKESDIHGGIPAKTIHEFLAAWKQPSIEQILQVLMGSDAQIHKEVK